MYSLTYTYNGNKFQQDFQTMDEAYTEMIKTKGTITFEDENFTYKRTKGMFISYDKVK